MTSVYKKDRGNGVVIYADEYVKSGQWVYDCKYSRLISRRPLPAPIADLEQANQLTIGDIYLDASEQELAKAAIRAATAKQDWYKHLRYLYSVLGESSTVSAHLFDLLTEHEGRTWALRVVQQVLYGGEYNFMVDAEPYNPDTYVDYAKALQAAARSCPVPQ
ncbi:hypothetical protein KSS93_06125 [Pseudomonas xanthosomatis]|uniref:hypothetical protein n=1 Tax=Pseudomonas xanthosomatis TaxID=2842356 RepID=UPI001C3C9221|nr:hypothetical protein [Pseudomonas xanthosomatis]QXH47495.1 hypothetical protein KSS93_06125 [Pseudomonas xanthosomatis]